MKIDVEEGAGYKASTAPITEEDDWTFTISKAEPSITVTAAPTSDIAGKTITVTAKAATPGNSALTDVPAPTLTYKVGENGAETAFTDSFVIPEGTANGTVITITAKTAESDNYNAGTGTAEVIVSDCEHTDVTTEWEKDSTVHWHICSYCGASVDKAEHISDGGTVTKEPTETAEGERTFKCTVCDWVIRTEAIAKLGHTHSLAEDYSSDAAGHWFDCSECDEKVDFESHTEDGGTITKEPTETTEGEKIFKCEKCGYVIRTETVPAFTKEEAVKSFVERLYENVLGRPSDPSKESHIDNLNNGETATKVAYDFVFSSEFTELDISNEERVRIMYLTFLDREPDPDGFATWTKALDNGCSIGHIFYGFTQSGEFGEICDKYGIEQGTWEYTENRDKSAELTSFVSRLYTKALNRKFDVDGLNDHTGSYLENHDLYQLAYNFIFSQEFIEKNLSDEDFVDTMYRTFFDREADPDGRADWLGRLKSGCSREDVLAGFVGSQECADLVAKFGI